VVQVGEAAVGQRAHEVERQRRALVAAQQQLRIRRAILLGEGSRLTLSPRYDGR
jgi:hypothetical protein